MGKLIHSVTNCNDGLIILVFGVLFLILFLPNTSIPSEREVKLGEEYQTEMEKRALEDRFEFSLGWAYGITSSTENHIISGWYDLDPTYAYYLDRLGLEYSRNFMLMRITGRYLISPRLGIFATVPFGSVEPRRQRVGIFPDFDEEYEFDLGDITGGLSYFILPETEVIPLTRIDLSANANNAEYTSVGNGVWDVTGGLQLMKHLSETFYVLGLGDYTYTIEENDVNPGDITGYGGGIGFIFDEGTTRTEISLKKVNIGEAEINDIKWLPKNDYLLLNLSLITNFGGMNIFMAGLEEGFDSDRNSFGLEYFISF